MTQKDETIKPILQLVANLQQSKFNNKQKELIGPEKNATQEPLSDDGVLFIWKKMTAIYGDQWLSRRGPSNNADGSISEMAKEWKSILAGLTAKQVKEGFNTLVKNLIVWPPNAIDFRKYCLSRDQDRETQKQLIKRDQATLEEQMIIRSWKKSDQETGKKYLSDLKKSLNPRYETLA